LYFTTKKYLQKLRLNATRDKLIKANTQDIKVSYIALPHGYIHYDKGSGLVKDFDLYGPKLGVVFHF
jgi:hypothetical protein